MLAMLASSALALALSLPARPALPTMRVPGCLRMMCVPTEMPASLPAGFATVWPMLQSAAVDEAGALGMTVKSISFARGKLTVLAAGGDSDALEALNRRLGDLLDGWEQVDGDGGDGTAHELPAYVLEVASPGLSDVLQSDRDFITFKGFEVTAKLSEEFKNKDVHRGTLLGARARPCPRPTPIQSLFCCCCSTPVEGMRQAMGGGKPLRTRFKQRDRPLLTCRASARVHYRHAFPVCLEQFVLLLCFVLVFHRARRRSCAA